MLSQQPVKGALMAGRHAIGQGQTISPAGKLLQGLIVLVSVQAKILLTDAGDGAGQDFCWPP